MSIHFLSIVDLAVTPRNFFFITRLINCFPLEITGSVTIFSNWMVLTLNQSQDKHMSSANRAGLM